jgi:hypothetical protein
MASFDSIYRADVVDANDPEKRLRVRVRVRGIHSPDMATQSLPYAEIAGPAGRGMRGLFCPYRKDDVVFVQFEFGNERYPVVIGGAISNAAGVNDTPFEMQQDDAGSSRVMLMDQNGSALEISSDPADQWIRIKSGGAEVRVCSKDDGIIIDAAGKVKLRGDSVVVQSTIAEVSATTINIDARSGDSEAGVATLDSDNRTDILSAADVNIGGRVENVMGVPQPQNPLNTGSAQAENTNVRSKVVNLGVGGAPTSAVSLALGGSALPETDAMPGPIPAVPVPPVPLLPTTTVNIRASAAVNVESSGTVAVRATSVEVKAITSVSVTSAVAVSISAPSITMGL